jgi:hypothetical protein
MCNEESERGEIYEIDDAPGISSIISYIYNIYSL